MTLKKLQPSRPATSGTHQRQIRVLYVEDEDVNWEVTLLHLNERYLIERAKDARQAFEALRKQTFHAILMDIQLSNSELDGVGITKALRGTYKGVLPDYAKDFTLPNVPIVFMTAYSARYSRSELIALGGDDLVLKPIDFTLLGLCLSRCLLKGVANQ